MVNKYDKVIIILRSYAAEDYFLEINTTKTRLKLRQANGPTPLNTSTFLPGRNCQTDFQIRK